MKELTVNLITSLCSSIAQAEEGAPTEVTGTAAADGNLLDLFDSDCTAGPGFKGNHLGEHGDECLIHAKKQRKKEKKKKDIL